MSETVNSQTISLPTGTMFWLTFFFSQTMALLTLSATAVLTVNLLSRSCIHAHIHYKTYMFIVIYSEVPLCFLCAFIAEQLFRASPSFFGIVFVLLKTIGRLLCVSYIAYSGHFWAESCISLLVAMSGSQLAYKTIPILQRNQPVNPAMALLAGITIPAFTWLVTLMISTLR